MQFAFLSRIMTMNFRIGMVAYDVEKHGGKSYKQNMQFVIYWYHVLLEHGFF